MTEVAGSVSPNGPENLSRKVNEKHAPYSPQFPLRCPWARQLIPISSRGIPARLMLEDCGRAGQLPGVNVCKCIKVKQNKKKKQRKKRTTGELGEPSRDKWRLEKSI